MTERQIAYFQSHSRCRVSALLTSCFVNAQLLTLCYGPDAPSLPIADRQYRTLMVRARYLAGGPFDYVKLIDYSPSSASVLAYRLIVDLPAEVCREIAHDWYMGSASVEPLDEQKLAALAADLLERPEGKREKGRRRWTTSIGLTQQMQRIS